MTFVDKYGPWAVVAGGSDGIGAAFARSLAARGLNVVPIARGSDALEDLAKDIRSSNPATDVRPVAVDLSLDDAGEQVAAATADLEVGCLVYNVGSEPAYGDFLGHDWDFVHGRLTRNIVTKTALVHH